MTEPEPPTETDPFRLRIIATTDMHAPLLAGASGPGIAAIGTAIGQERRGAGASVLLDNGDFLQGGPEGDYLAECPADWPGGHHPVVAAMNELGYDAAAAGNHDFDYGLGILMRAAAGATFPVLCANVDFGGHGSGLPGRATIRRQLSTRSGRRAAITLGVLGLTAPGTVAETWAKLPPAMAEHEFLQTLRAEARALRRDGADLVIALCHVGPAPDGRGCGLVADIARSGAADVLILGHSHRHFPGPLAIGCDGFDARTGTIFGLPAVLPGSMGSHIGTIDLSLSRHGALWRVDTARVALRPVVGPSGPPAPNRRVAALLAKPAADCRAALARPLGASATALHGFFSVLGPSSAIGFVAAAKLFWARTNMDSRALPVLSADTPYLAGGLGGPDNFVHVPAGPVRCSDLFSLSPFPNLLCPVVLSGADIAAWLNAASALYKDLARDGIEPQTLIDPAIPSHRLVEFSGLSYAFDLSAPAASGRRVTGLTYLGRPVRDTDRFAVLTNDHQISRLGWLPGGQPRPLANAANLPRMAEVLGEYLRTGAGRRGGTQPRTAGWGLTPLGGVRVDFDTGPGARAFQAEIAHLTPRAAGLTADGFLRYRLTL